MWRLPPRVAYGTATDVCAAHGAYPRNPLWLQCCAMFRLPRPTLNRRYSFFPPHHPTPSAEGFSWVWVWLTVCHSIRFTVPLSLVVCRSGTSSRRWQSDTTAGIESRLCTSHSFKLSIAGMPRPSDNVMKSRQSIRLLARLLMAIHKHRQGLERVRGDDLRRPDAFSPQ